MDSVKTYLTFIFFFFFGTELFAQNINRYLEEGDQYLSSGDFYNASLNYVQYLKEDSLNKLALSKYAESLRLLNDFEKAKVVYLKLYKKDRGISFPESMFWLAMVHKSLGEYEEAKLLFDKYNKLFKKKGTYTALKSQVEMNACDWAQKEVRQKSTTRIEQLDSTKNTAFSEFAPSVLDSVLFFSSSKENLKQNKKNLPKTAIYSSKNNAAATLVSDSIFNSQEINTGNLSFSSDGKSCYFTRCVAINPTEMKCAIYARYLKDGKWSNAKRLNDTINQPEYSSTQPCIAKVDSVGTVLYYSSNRKGGEGKMDIWACKISPTGVFGIPYNLGKNVNTMDNEITPFFNESTQTLYFSSDWHAGFGGYDIFKTNRKNRAYQVPINLGKGINSSYNDLYYNTNTTETRAYFASNREGSFYDTYQNCCNDIYVAYHSKIDSVIKVIPPPVIVAKKDTVIKIVNQLKLLVPLTLYFDNDEPDSKTLATSTDKSYQETFLSYLKQIDNYKSNYTIGLRGDKKNDAASAVEAVFSDSIEFGMQQLDKFSKLLAKIVPEGEQVKITLKGYCSALASSEYNKNLARRRISCLRNYFATYNNGELLPFIVFPGKQPQSKGSIEFTEVEIGELETKSSDDLKNKRLSVYSPDAVLERKIQIIAISSK